MSDSDNDPTLDTCGCCAASQPATTAPDRPNGAASPSNKGGSNGQGNESPNPLTPSYNDLVRQINILQQQVIAEQDQNKRLKGAA